VRSRGHAVIVVPITDEEIAAARRSAVAQDPTL
jgi:hypothetical protein